jgi:NAD(P)H dehydrogenase (quinone)
MVKVLVLFYSTYGHIFQLAQAIAEGAKEVEGAQVDIKRVPETLSQEILEKMHAVEAQKAFAHIPVASPQDLADYDVILFGTPTRYGMMAAQMKNFLDATGGLWAKGALVGKVGAVFTSTATQHGGQETTILSFHTVLLHHGFVIVGLPYTWGGHYGHDEVKGASPYGISTIAGSNGERLPSKVELDGARFQGKHATEIGKKLAAK